MTNVAANTIVTIRYIMRNGRNEELENNMNGTPVRFLYGAGNISPLLQTQLNDLGPGDKKIVYLTRENAGVDDDYIFEVTIDDVRNASPEELLLGYPLPIDENNCDNDCFCYQPGYSETDSTNKQ
jgi:FKBP-type peptidyl-prolyl cis-trans isomerase SlyD